MANFTLITLWLTFLYSVELFYTDLNCYLNLFGHALSLETLKVMLNLMDVVCGRYNPITN